MYAIKNIQFTRLYKVNGFLKEFNFRKSNASLEGTVSVDTIDERGNRIMFFMEQKEGSWRILQQELPTWIMDQEPNLDEALKGEVGG